jgi:hypothetical protein
VYVRNIDTTSSSGPKPMVFSSPNLCRDQHRRVQVEYFDEVHCGLHSVGNYDFRRASKAESDTAMVFAVFPRLVLDYCCYHDGGARRGMSPTFLPLLPGSSVRFHFASPPR